MIKKLAIISFLIFLPGQVWATGKVYRINDCNGSPQQIGTVVSEKTEISAEFPEAVIPSGLEVSLTNIDSKEVLKKPLKEKKISFTGVPEGEWELCIKPQKISFINVDIK